MEHEDDDYFPNLHILTHTPTLYIPQCLSLTFNPTISYLSCISVFVCLNYLILLIILLLLSFVLGYEVCDYYETLQDMSSPVQ